jgi:hypothetical protein
VVDGDGRRTGLDGGEDSSLRLQACSCELVDLAHNSEAVAHSTASRHSKESRKKGVRSDGR